MLKSDAAIAFLLSLREGLSRAECPPRSHEFRRHATSDVCCDSTVDTEIHGRIVQSLLAASDARRSAVAILTGLKD
jgi:hypothetical protein